MTKEPKTKPRLVRQWTVTSTGRPAGVGKTEDAAWKHFELRGKASIDTAVRSREFVRILSGLKRKLASLQESNAILQTKNEEQRIQIEGLQKMVSQGAKDLENQLVARRNAMVRRDEELDNARETIAKGRPEDHLALLVMGLMAINHSTVDQAVGHLFNHKLASWDDVVKAGEVVAKILDALKPAQALSLVPI